MFKHHEDTIDAVSEFFRKQDGVSALLLSGSIAHGFETEASDVDVMIVVSAEEYAERMNSGSASFFSTELCTFEGGYVDGKYICLDFMKKVAECGSEPARFAFEGAKIIFSGFDGLEDLIREITAYPADRKTENIRRFYAQFEAWKWYCGEALRQKNSYLLTKAVSSFILFSGRLILAHNDVLYPYHKWFMKVLHEVPEKPENLLDYMNSLLSAPCEKSVEKLYQCVLTFREWPVEGISWPAVFMTDSELNWLEGSVPVCDI